MPRNFPNPDRTHFLKKKLVIWVGVTIALLLFVLLLIGP